MNLNWLWVFVPMVLLAIGCFIWCVRDWFTQDAVDDAYGEEPWYDVNRCNYQPEDQRYAPCTREKGHDGPCAHEFK